MGTRHREYIHSTGDEWLDLLAGVVRLAVRDAQGKNKLRQEQATSFLDACLPDWRQLAERFQKRIGDEDARFSRFFDEL